MHDKTCMRCLMRVWNGFNAAKAGRFMMRTVLAMVLAVVWNAPLEAGPDRFSVLMGSKHFGSNGFNEINPGLFATWEGEKLAYSLGAYLNSYDRGSLAATAHVPVFRWKGGEASAFAGLAWYPKDGHRFQTQIGGDIVGIGGLNLRHGHAFVQLIPMVTNGAQGLASFGFTWEAKP